MRHNKKINHLGRTASHRKAMLSNMAASLILHKKIVTTIAKAKSLRTFVEPLITKSKEDTVHSRRTVFSYLQNKFAVKELFLNVANKIADRPGGYTRILKTGNRLGDNADMCLIELVDFNEALLKEKERKKVKSTRRSRSKKSKDEVVEPKAKASEKKAEKTSEKELEEPKAEEKTEQISEEPTQDITDEEKGDEVSNEEDSEEK